jgi:sugar phosphate permease
VAQQRLQQGRHASAAAVAQVQRDEAHGTGSVETQGRGSFRQAVRLTCTGCLSLPLGYALFIMKNFYGWRIVFAGGTLQLFQSMLLNQAFGAYLAALVQDTGWSKTALSGAAALKSTESALLGPVLGWLVDRLGSRLVVRAGVILFGLGFMLLSQTHTLVTFYAAFVVLALGASMCSNMVVSVAIIQWFQKRRARALSSSQFGAAVGGLFVVAVAWVIQTYGWRVAAFGSGVILIVCGWPLASMIRSRPEDVGQRIDGLPPDADAAAPREPRVGAAPAARRVAPAEGDFTARQALRTRSFWLLSLGHACSLFVVSAINVHAIVHIKEGLGYSLALASLYITIATAGQFVGVVCGWVIPEKIEKRKVTALTMLLHASGMLMLTYASGSVILVLSALVHGFGWGLRGPFIAAMRADYFGRNSIGMILGLSSMIMVIGQIGGPLIAGAFADWLGNYRAGFTLIAALAAIGSLFFWMAKRPV